MEPGIIILFCVGVGALLYAFYEAGSKPKPVKLVPKPVDEYREALAKAQKELETAKLEKTSIEQLQDHHFKLQQSVLLHEKAINSLTDRVYDLQYKIPSRLTVVIKKEKGHAKSRNTKRTPKAKK